MTEAGLSPSMIRDYTHSITIVPDTTLAHTGPDLPAAKAWTS